MKNANVEEKRDGLIKKESFEEASQNLDAKDALSNASNKHILLQRSICKDHNDGRYIEILQSQASNLNAPELFLIDDELDKRESENQKIFTNKNTSEAFCFKDHRNNIFKENCDSNKPLKSLFAKSNQFNTSKGRCDKPNVSSCCTAKYQGKSY